MKHTYKNKNVRGFTLIELLVVISIISLLSSIVLASVSTAKSNAIETAYRRSVDELILALEMVKVNTGFYPGESIVQGNSSAMTTYSLNTSASGVKTVSSYENPNLGLFNFPNDLNPYLKTLPFPTTNNKQTVYILAGSTSANQYRCVGDAKTPVFIIYTDQTAGFKDWPNLQMTISPNNWVTLSLNKCYSPK